MESVGMVWMYVSIVAAAWCLVTAAYQVDWWMQSGTSVRAPMCTMGSHVFAVLKHFLSWKLCVQDNITLVYKKKTFFELFQICQLVFNVSSLLN